MYYSFNKDSNHPDCEITPFFDTPVSPPNKLLDLKESLENNYKGMQTVPWEKNGTIYHLADY
jgi:hypothetical protein